MSINAAITHRTTYRYDRPITLGPQVVRLRPAPHSRTRILAYSHKVSPEEHWINWQQDPFGNWLARLVFPEKVDHFQVEVDLVADMASINPFDFFVEERAEGYPFTYSDTNLKELAPYLETSAQGPLFEQFLKTMPKNAERSVDWLVEVNQLVQRRIEYLVRMEPGVQTPEESLKIGSGSCRDSGWLLVHLMRRMGLAARFVSGYLIQLTPDIKAIDGPSGPAADFTDLHAWTEVYVPGAGWVGLDPTSGLFASEGHIPLAATPTPGSAAPITGALEKAEVEFDFFMEVRRVREEPRVTKPFSDEAWQAIDAAGKRVDEMLQRSDVRLTMGGEPTFVAAGDRDAPEWNTDAVGPTKRLYADRLIRRLRDRFAPGGLLHYGQGKWYPGEQLPRWAFGLHWRKDGEPLWQDAQLVAREGGGGASSAQAADFAIALAERLEVDPDCVAPVYEDPATHLLREAQLPDNLDPATNQLEDPLERRQLAMAFERGLGTPTAMVLPIQLAQSQAAQREQPRRHYRWMTERWNTRRGRLYLIPGDSPAGFRLPLASLYHIRARDFPYIHPMDPFAPRDRLLGRRTRRQPQGPQRLGADNLPPIPPSGPGGGMTGPAGMAQPPIFAAAPPPLRYQAPPMDTAEAFYDAFMASGGTEVPGLGPDWVIVNNAVRTALTVEVRDGRLCVFLPPVPDADSYVDLIAAIEEAAEQTGLPVHVEGYTPPFDYRLGTIKVTPDPGVIEVNIQPAESWEEQIEITEGIYDDARHVGLETTKFLYDGRPAGSGGGNHIVVGAAAPADSPFLRRPDLLASLVRYWQNHPSLSYLFSGQFIGPTSQAPRVDEARHEALFELEIAMGQVPSPGGGYVPPWLVDRIFRNLLIDATGNTHRAEICIDKLYSPDGPTGRLGLVEFRAFEMPPHPRMSLAQSLVLRGLIAKFWEQPYTRPLVRFGTALHDRYMLPHYVWEDFLEVLADLTEATGLSFDPEWFVAQFEFRFPLIGDVVHRDMTLEVRAAIEPWHVLGETGAIGGTVRYVDSSLERVQVKLSGDLSERYTLTCNGWEVPLRNTAEKDVRVAGIRFRAWQPPECLHPTIGVHGPLVFDLHDRWSGRSIGGCVAHVSHPGGRGFDNQPVNDLEAEGRRMARFEPMGHTPGLRVPRSPRMSPEYPLTLDLRLQH